MGNNPLGREVCRVLRNHETFSEIRKTPPAARNVARSNGNVFISSWPMRRNFEITPRSLNLWKYGNNHLGRKFYHVFGNRENVHRPCVKFSGHVYRFLVICNVFRTGVLFSGQGSLFPAIGGHFPVRGTIRESDYAKRIRLDKK